MSQQTPVIKFARLKGWLIPQDAESYQLLKKVGMPLCKMHEDLVPALQMAVRGKGIRAKVSPFSEVLDTYLDKVGAQWNSKDARKCKIDETQRRLTFTGPLTSKNEKAVDKLDSSLKAFFARWGFSYNAVYSTDTVSNKLKLVADYKFDVNRNPIIPDTEVVDDQPVELVLGFTKIRISFNKRREVSGTAGDGFTKAVSKVGAPYHLLEVLNQAGTEWQVIHTGTFIDETIGDLNKWLVCMAGLANTQKVKDE